jgi:hypothetical protein
MLTYDAASPLGIAIGAAVSCSTSGDPVRLNPAQGRGRAAGQYQCRPRLSGDARHNRYFAPAFQGVGPQEAAMPDRFEGMRVVTQPSFPGIFE